MINEISNVNVITDDINKPYGIYLSIWANKDPDKKEMVIRLSRSPEPDFKDIEQYKKLHGITSI